MWKATVCAFLVAVVLTAAMMAHALNYGLMIPYPDPTPEQEATARYHEPISKGIFLAVTLAWLVTVLLAGGWVELAMKTFARMTGSGKPSRGEG